MCFNVYEKLSIAKLRNKIFVESKKRNISLKKFFPFLLKWNGQILLTRDFNNFNVSSFAWLCGGTSVVFEVEKVCSNPKAANLVNFWVFVVQMVT